MSALIHTLSALDCPNGNHLEIRRSLHRADGVHAVRIPYFFTPEECRDMVATIHRLQPYWRPGTLYGEYSLGRSWYTAIDNRDILNYFDEADYLNQVIDASFPGLLDKILHFCRQWVSNRDAEPAIRPGWAGPGIMIFHPYSGTAKKGGSIHIDYEGVSKRLADASEIPPEVYSFMLPLQMPLKGGNLRTWPEVYRRYHHNRYLAEIRRPAGSMHVTPYATGCLHGISSWRVHQIEPFKGENDRVVLTFHLGNLDGSWYVWF